ncbi:effector-associated domain 2-containing protein [Planosporangium sp. 12N6]|uniref:VMAP-C domain-containing protein n=1 Tax=Planosporangium spinosum TaxID=3402278 RepID=UPI003CEAF4AF
MPPTADNQRRLVDAILRLPGAQNRESRDRYVAAVGSLLGVEPDFPRAEAAPDDLTRLVAWCAAARPDGLRVLVEAVAGVEEQGGAVDRLRAVGSIGRPAEVLQPHERARVEELLARLDHASRAAMVRDLASRWGPRLRPDTREPQTLLRLLEDSIAGADEPHPLYTFLSRLAQAFRDTPYEDLGDLVSEVGYRTSGGPVMLADPAATPDPGRYYFVVRLAEDGLAPSRYLVHVWLADDRGAWELRYTSDSPHLLAEVRTMVDDQLAALAEDEAVEIDALSIEFILPRALLDHGVDQWLVSAPGVSNAIGVHYPVVVRDLARMRNRIIRSRWRQRCRWLNGHGHPTAAKAVRFEHLNGTAPDIFAELMQDPECPACLVVLGPSAAHVAGRVGAWLSAGIPVVVWCRHDGVSARFDTHLPSILISGGIGSLPTAVWRLRQDSGRVDSGHEHVGKHITLLWDDENRMPPDERGRLRQPAPYS